MKILWFTNTPCSAAEKLYPGLIGGSWLSALEKELSASDEIELHIVFYHTEEIAPFIYNNTWFYPILRKNSSSKLHRYFARLLRFENNDKTEIKQLVSTVELIKPDLIHIHGTEENFGLIQKHTKIPAVVSIQGILSPYVEKYYSGIPQHIADKYDSLKSKILIKTTKYKFQNLKRKSIREHEILKLSKNIIGRTSWDKRVTRILSPHSNYFVGQEMLRDTFYNNSWRKLHFGQKIQIVTISNNRTYKGLETIIKTANILSNYPKFDFEWLVIGINKTTDIVLLIQKWLKINPDNIHIKFLGNKTEKEIVDLLLSADIYCQVSHIENSPNSLCEAMLLGLPVVASFAGGTSTILENEKEGILIQDGEPYVLSGAILELSNDYTRAFQLGQNAKDKATKRHDKNLIVADLLNIYKTVIKG